MTTDECWKLIADCTIRGDWTGVLVAADALQEAGDEATAVAIRWAISRKWYPVTVEVVNRTNQHRTQFKLYLLVGQAPLVLSRDSCTDGIREGWEWVTEVRQEMLDMVGVLPLK